MSDADIAERDRIERLEALLEQLQQDADVTARPSRRNTRRVRWLIRVLGLLMAALALSNLYFVNTLTQDVRQVIAQMEIMTSYFVRVSERMHSMRGAVAAMEADVRLMPVVDAQVTAIGENVGAMGNSVDDMERSTAGLNQRVASMRGAMDDMARRFRGLNARVGAMGVDVREMAKPVP
ncbi:hypothetical protein [Thiocapsa bogorovii]|uniref:hypothetical protein n=1 Tax=Thiocapsa bogorovii TaxID=521689 RepID=UPI001E2BB3EA|nr:hypothetical protein [Thiocapsa bogorovii]UHD14350.1 hypothetical protein LT988_13655 [Thiocapsa bogorovii]